MIGDFLMRTSVSVFSLVFGALLFTLGCDDGGTTSGDNCGDGILDPGEACDGDSFGGETCVTLGFYGGTLACSETCHIVQTDCEGTGYCGDGVIQAPNEQCDQDSLGGATCDSQGQGTGTLTCNTDCTFNLTDCSGVNNCPTGYVELPQQPGVCREAAEPDAGDLALTEVMIAPVNAANVRQGQYLELYNTRDATLYLGHVDIQFEDNHLTVQDIVPAHSY